MVLLGFVLGFHSLWFLFVFAEAFCFFGGLKCFLRCFHMVSRLLWKWLFFGEVLFGVCLVVALC